MAFINGSDFDHIKALCEGFMADPKNWADGESKTCSMVSHGAQAWDIAHRAKVVEFCYGNTAKDIPGITGCYDAHIRTALRKIFPNAEFNSKG